MYVVRGGMSSPLDKPSKEGPRWKSVMEFSILILLYLCLNSTLNIMNRWALGIYGFTFPILLTICHMMFAFVVLLPVMAANTKLQHKATLKRQYKGLICIGVFMALNVSLNNLSLVQISLSLNQVIRCGAIFDGMPKRLKCLVARTRQYIVTFVNSKAPVLSHSLIGQQVLTAWILIFLNPAS